LMRLVAGREFLEIFPKTPPPGKKWTETEWELDVKGRRDPTWRCAGRGGSITGGRADYIIADDVVTLESCSTPGERNRTWEWWSKTLMQMLIPGGTLLIIGTPYNEDDLYARLQNAGMKAMVYPAEDEEGKILWPGRFSREELDARKVAPLGTPASYASQYLCNPTPKEGAMIRRDWLRYYEKLPEVFDVMIASWDMAFKGSDGGDGRSWVVGQVWGRRGARIYLVDQVRGRWDFPQTLGEVRALARKWPMAVAKIVEDAANGPAVVAALNADLRDGVGGLVLVRPEGGKESRVAAISGLIQAGNVYFPRHAPWLEDLIRECLAFPNSAYSDQVDSMSQGLLHFIHTGVWTGEYGEPEKEEEEEFQGAVERLRRLTERPESRKPSSGWSETA